jgi:cytidylate kinase
MMEDQSLSVHPSTQSPPHPIIRSIPTLADSESFPKIPPAMIITIDGPAGTGKSTVALALAERLGFDFLDTGAMYRAVGLEALRRGANLDDSRELAFIARHVKIDFDWSKQPPGVLLNGDSVGHLLRGGEATRAASYVAVVPAIRELLVAQQQRIGGERKNLVTEGRDQGTIVFPSAAVKFYLDATPQERARRRATQLRARGEIVDQNEILNQIVTRDTRDATRSVGPLSVPGDAAVIDTTALSQDQVLDQMVARIAAVQRVT